MHKTMTIKQTVRAGMSMSHSPATRRLMPKRMIKVFVAAVLMAVAIPLSALPPDIAAQLEEQRPQLQEELDQTQRQMQAWRDHYFIVYDKGEVTALIVQSEDGSHGGIVLGLPCLADMLRELTAGTAPNAKYFVFTPLLDYLSAGAIMATLLANGLVTTADDYVEAVFTGRWPQPYLDAVADIGNELSEHKDRYTKLGASLDATQEFMERVHWSKEVRATIEMLAIRATQDAVWPGNGQTIADLAGISNNKEASE